MILAQGRLWRAEIRKGSDSISISLLRESLPEELEDLKDLRIDVPLGDWNRLVRPLRQDRKLLGGILLDFAKSKEHLAAAVASDRLFLGLHSLILEASLALIEEERLALVPIADES